MGLTDNWYSNTGYKYLLFKKAGGCLALSLYVFLHIACFHFELLELVPVDLFLVNKL